MVDKIYALKNKILEQIEKEISERGVDRMDVDRIGEMVDMVKDLAQAEESCWEAQYFRMTTSGLAEDKYGYSGSGNMMQSSDNMSRRGYGANGGSMGHGDIIKQLGEEFMKLPREERMAMKSEVISMLGSV